jgi:hypothetical protein
MIDLAVFAAVCCLLAVALRGRKTLKPLPKGGALRGTDFMQRDEAVDVARIRGEGRK